MRDYLKEKEICKNEDIYFKYLKLMQERSLSEKEKSKFLKSMGLKICYLEEEFLIVKEKGNNNSLVYIAINNGLSLISELKEGLNITSKLFVRENIEQWAAHFESVREYEDSFIEFYNNQTKENFEDTIDCFEDSKDYLEGYTKEKTLTMC